MFNLPIFVALLLQQAQQQGILQLETNGEGGEISPTEIAPKVMSLADYVWEFPDAATLANLLQAVPKILEQSAAETSPHLVCRHLEAIATAHYKKFTTAPQLFPLLASSKSEQNFLLKPWVGNYATPASVALF